MIAAVIRWSVANRFLVLLAAAVVVVVLCRLVRLPPILGYLIVGAAVGPHALGWVANDQATRYVAEFGLVFLLFSVGLEFSLPKLNARVNEIHRSPPALRIR